MAKHIGRAVTAALGDPAIRQIVVRGLIDQRANIDGLIRALGGPAVRGTKRTAQDVVAQAFAADGAEAATNGARANVAARPQRRYRLSAAARKRAAEAMRARWAKAKREGRSLSGKKLKN
jgi:hypothetical protein